MIEALQGLASYEPIAYLALLYGAVRLAAVRGNGQQRVVLDVIFIVWVACSVIREAFGDSPHVAFGYMLVDIVAALWLASKVRGRVSGIAETFFLSMILFNFVIWSRGEINSWMHWTGLALLSLGQIIGVVGGILRHELRGIVSRAAARLGLRGRLAVRKGKAGGDE